MSLNDCLQVGRWYFDPRDFRLWHRKPKKLGVGSSYDVSLDVSTLTEEQAVELLHEFSRTLPPEEIEDFGQFINLFLCLDRDKLRQQTRPFLAGVKAAARGRLWGGLRKEVA